MTKHAGHSAQAPGIDHGSEKPNIRYVVEPRPLPNVRDQHYDGIFGDFDDVIDLAIEANKAKFSGIAPEFVRFFEHLKEMVDRKKFLEMQRLQLSDEKLDLNVDLAKYIDPVCWFESKLRLARQIKLHQRPPMRILDIGTGPGHWPTVAQFYGHEVLGTELPLRATGNLGLGHLYDALGEIYKIRRVPLRVLPFTPLPDFGQRFDMVTAFLAAFNVDQNKQPWSVEMWDFFFRDLRKNVLTGGGEVYMSVTQYKAPPEIWSYLKSLAESWNDDSMVIHISDLSRFD